MRDELLRLGVLVGVGGIYGNVVRFQPPLIISRQQIDFAMQAFAEALRRLGSAGPNTSGHETPAHMAGNLA